VSAEAFAARFASTARFTFRLEEHRRRGAPDFAVHPDTFAGDREDLRRRARRRADPGHRERLPLGGQAVAGFRSICRRDRLPRGSAAWAEITAKQGDSAGIALLGELSEQPGVVRRARADREHAEFFVFLARLRYFDLFALPFTAIPVQHCVLFDARFPAADRHDERTRFGAAFAQRRDQRRADVADETFVGLQQCAFAFCGDGCRFPEVTSRRTYEHDFSQGLFVGCDRREQRSCAARSDPPRQRTADRFENRVARRGVAR